MPPGDRVDPLDLTHAPRAATDDWPFLYLREPSISTHYILALAMVLAFAAGMVTLAARRAGIRARRFSPFFFVLGVAFLLLETRSLVTFSLLFGTTWLVNALVFFGILASVLLAIWVNTVSPIRRPWILYVGLVLAILASWLVPGKSLLIDPPWLRYGVAIGLAFAPVFFANLVFSHAFRDTLTADMAFAANLLGAMVGGAVKYAAMALGYQALLLIVAGLYVAAWLASTHIRLLADRDLVPSVQLSDSGA